jgi:hypothetical protein
VAIQVKDTAFMENVSLIWGNDKLIADPMKGTKKEAKQRTANAEFRFIFQVNYR